MNRNAFLTSALFALMLPAAQASVIYVTDSVDNTVSTIVRDQSTGVWSPGSTLISGLNAPMGIAVDAAGNIYVANSGGAGEIWKYDSAGQNGVHHATMAAVSWIAVDLVGNLFAVSVTDTKIAKFDTAGAFVTERTGLDAPGAVTIGGDGYVYLVSGDGTGAVEIHKLDSNLTTQVPFVTADLNTPGGLAFRGSELFVSNWFPPAVGDPRVDQFDGSGTAMTGYSDPSLGFAQGLAFSLFGDLFVAHGGTVSRFDAGGTLQDNFAFTSPMGLAASAVPEPETYAMIGSGLLLLGLVKRKR